MVLYLRHLDEMWIKIAKFLGIEDEEDPNELWNGLLDKARTDSTSWVSIYRLFFEDYYQKNDSFLNADFDFFHAYEYEEYDGFLNIIKKVMHRDGLTPADLPELCAAVGEEFERFHQRFFIEAQQLKSGQLKESDYSPSSYQDWNLSDYEEPLEYHILMIELLQLWQYFPQILQWRTRTKKVFHLLENTFKSLSSDYKSLESLGYEYYYEPFYETYHLIDRITLDEHFRIIKLDLCYYTVRDLSPLASLHNLQKLHLGESPFSLSHISFDISPLVHLVNLKYITFSSCAKPFCNKNLRESITCPALLELKDQIQFV